MTEIYHIRHEGMLLDYAVKRLLISSESSMVDGEKRVVAHFALPTPGQYEQHIPPHSILGNRLRSVINVKRHVICDPAEWSQQHRANTIRVTISGASAHRFLEWQACMMDESIRLEISPEQSAARG